MKIQALQTGSTLVSSAVPDRSSHHWKLAYTDLFQTRSHRISVPVKAFLVENKGHLILVDTGWSADCVKHPIRHLGFGLWFASEPVLKEGESVPEQLLKIGLKPQDINAIVLTHLDCDHVSGLLPLKEVKHIYCSQEEWGHAQKKDVRYRKAFWKSAHVEMLAMQDDPKAPFGKSCDLFGDGSVRVIFTPGHSEGSVAILAYDGGNYAAFVGDDSYNRHSWEELKLPGPVYDEKEMLTTLKWVQSLSKDPACIGIYAAHDGEGPVGTEDK